MLREITFFLVFQLISVVLWAQNPIIHFRSLNVDNGLSQQTVNVIFEDKNGFIYIGTQDGLDVFDGYEIKTYTSIPNDSNSLAGNNISSIVEDNRDYLWVGTYESGISRIDTRREEIKNYQYTSNDNYSEWNSINVIYKGRKSEIWAGTNRGLIRYDSLKDDFQYYPLDIVEGVLG
ncbi:MAG: hypothetical protein OEW75_08035, partial [Cyclobacteriaceae bacterium]|nr:hypothetical protein [Cyclobacteriaceae bacterium]